ncbi:ArsR/SmtB family transcription factor [Planococcus sp. 4-30]|uniref:ArsR/SmtB family transcription factor n=1 Tax=Planococcus sp. 4-30 TaxID=2874583 RepID=UPI001CC077DC|nr:metalloregulator ArsR/SmtB family transcription factor [Planococcus sp. 4-30]
MEYDQMETYLKAIGDQKRLLILKFLAKEALRICEFTDLLEMTQPAISQHMRKLKHAGLVWEEKRGRWTIWSLNTQHMQYPVLIHLLDLLPEPRRSIGRLIAEGKK